MFGFRFAARGLFSVSALAAMFVLFARCAQAAEAPNRPSGAKTPAAVQKPIQVLLVTGAEYHNWRETAPALVRLLQADPRIEVRVIEDAHFLDSAALSRYHAVFLNYMNWQVPAPGPRARENLQRAVAKGTGLVLIHFACGAWQDWPEFVKLAGRVWNPKFRGHDPHGRFRVEIVDPEHPVTKGMQSFETIDELYTCLDGDEPIHVLATAKSKVDQKDYPMAFVHQYGKGRVFHCVLGHDVKALEPAAVGELLRRGTAWAAGQPPTKAK